MLIPCNVVDNRQIVDIIETEYFLQFQGNHSQRVGIVTLSGIKDTRYSVDIAEIQFIIFVFGTAGSQNNRIFWKCSGKICIVIAGVCPSIASCHDDKFFDRAGVDGLNNLAGKCKYLIVGKATNDFTVLEFFRSRTVFRLFDQCREILLCTDFAINVCASRIAGSTGGVQPVFVAVLWWNNTVGRHQNWSVETFKFFFLFPPCISVISDKVRIFFECRVVVGRKHF